MLEQTHRIGRVAGRVFVAGLALALVSACAGEQTDDSEAGAMEESMGQESSEMAAPELPDTTGAAVWSYLQEVGYADAWSTWPGKGELYEGQEPHGMLLTTYLNDAAHSALTEGAGTLPPGAIVVKENYTPDSTLAAVTTMYKVEGYNPDANDWYWVKHLPDGSVDADGNAQGRVEGCIGCHSGASDNDYVMTGPLGGEEGSGGE